MVEQKDQVHPFEHASIDTKKLCWHLENIRKDVREGFTMVADRLHRIGDILADNQTGKRRQY